MARKALQDYLGVINEKSKQSTDAEGKLLSPLSFSVDKITDAIHVVQQINLITCLEPEQTMEYLILAFKYQRYGTLLEKIYSQPLSVNFKKMLKNELLCQY